MDYTIGEQYTLPSHGKVYEKEVNPEIKIRSMTTSEEMKRLSRSDRPYKNLSEIIDDCLVENPGISSYDMCIGDYQFLLHKLRIVTYGTEYPLTSKCPYCGATLQDTINLEELKTIEYSEDMEKYFQLELPKTQKHILLQMQTPRMMDDVVVQSNELKRKSPSFLGDPAFLFTLKSLIKEIDGKKPDPFKVEDFIKNLPMMDANMIMKYAQKLNDSIGIDTILENTCDVCGLVYKSTFRTTAEFFGPSINI